MHQLQPGLTRTGVNGGATFGNPVVLQAFLDNQPIARHGEADDQARAVRFFAGPESSWITGQTLTVDGGNTLRSFIDNAELFPVRDQGDPANFR